MQKEIQYQYPHSRLLPGFRACFSIFSFSRENKTKVIPIFLDSPHTSQGMILRFFGGKREKGTTEKRNKDDQRPVEV